MDPGALRQAEWDKLPPHVQQQYRQQYQQQLSGGAARKRMPAWRIAINAAGVLLLIFLFGSIHITCGGGQGPGVCAKESWGLGDTFVDLDEFVGKPVITLVSRAKVVRALVRCKKLELPESFRRGG